MFVWKMYEADLFVWHNKLLNLHKPDVAMVYARVCSKLCITHKHNIKINQKFRINGVSCVSTEMCHKNSMLGLRNGPLPGITLEEDNPMINTNINIIIH